MQQMMATNPEQYLSTNQPRTTAHCLTRNVRKSTLTKAVLVLHAPFVKPLAPRTQRFQDPLTRACPALQRVGLGGEKGPTAFKKITKEYT